MKRGKQGQAFFVETLPAPVFAGVLVRVCGVVPDTFLTWMIGFSIYPH